MDRCIVISLENATEWWWLQGGLLLVADPALDRVFFFSKNLRPDAQPHETLPDRQPEPSFHRNFEAQMTHYSNATYLVSTCNKCEMGMISRL